MVTLKGKTLLLCGPCGNLINAAFDGVDSEKVPKKFCSLDALSKSGESCPLCQFFFRTISAFTGIGTGPLSIVARSQKEPAVMVALVGEDNSEVYFLPTRTDASLPKMMRSGDNVREVTWVKHPIHDLDAQTYLGSKWLNNCVNNHKGCQDYRQTTKDFQMPTRLLDVGLKDVQGRYKTPKLVVGLVEKARYAALSYRWGGKQPLILTLDSFSKFQQSMAFTDFPPLFQDCIRVCRAMGIQYLWIDAICIIQPESDGGEDWSMECTRMQSVYGGSVFTISASASMDPAEGLFTWRPDQIFPVKPSRVKRSKLGGGFCIAASRKSYSKDLTRLQRWSAHMDNLPISTRAWTLQERFLPVAVLHFYEGVASWECKSGLFEDDEGSNLIIEDKGPVREAAASKGSGLHEGVHVGERKHLAKDAPVDSEGASGKTLALQGNPSPTAYSSTTPDFKALQIDMGSRDWKANGEEIVNPDLKLIIPSHTTFSSAQSGFGWWYHLVRIYQRRRVTRVEDRLPAIGGVAEYFAKKLQATYVAGLWRDDFTRGLLWQRSPVKEASSPRPRVNSEAPTWSWARLDGHVEYVALNIFETSYGCEIDNISVKALHGPFGEVEEGFIVGRGVMRRVIRVNPGEEMTCTWSESIWGGNESLTSCIFDEIADHSADDLWLLVIDGTSSQDSIKGVHFLVLKRSSPHHPRYERVGLASCPSPAGASGWFHLHGKASKRAVWRGLGSPSSNYDHRWHVDQFIIV